MTTPPRETPDRIRELIALYRRTHYGVVLPDESRATLRIGEMPPRTIVDWIGVGGFAAYVTACNPYSRMLTDAQNEARAARLRERLSAARFLDGAGVIPDESWREPSLLINGIGLADIDALAHDFDQNAAVIVRSDRPAQLRIYRTDWRNIVGEPDIDWATELHGE